MATGDCNQSGPFSIGPALGAVGCTNANQNYSGQLSLCGSQ